MGKGGVEGGGGRGGNVRVLGGEVEMGNSQRKRDLFSEWIAGL